MERKFDYIVGTGGVGNGILFRLSEDSPLGKSESRLAYLTDTRDYCKLHIILHYAAVFLRGRIPVYAVSCVGDDEAGRQLLRQMKESGIQVGNMRLSEDKKTMYSVCYQFPDGDGGNLTSANGANQEVSEADIRKFFESPLAAGNGMALAAPEVPMDARICMLREGRKRHCMTVASVAAGEAAEFGRMGGYELTDLLAVNEAEAKAIADLGTGETEDALEACRQYLRGQNPDIILVVTRGSKGSHVFYKNRSGFAPACPVSVVNTAGAGDCFLGTMMAGLACGLPLMAQTQDGDILSTAQDLAALASARKVEKRDSIDLTMDKESLKDFAGRHGMRFSKQTRERFL